MERWLLNQQLLQYDKIKNYDWNYAKVRRLAQLLQCASDILLAVQGLMNESKKGIWLGQYE